MQESYLPPRLMRELASMIGQSVQELVWIVWPPLYEDLVAATDISVGLQIVGHSNLIRISVTEDAPAGAQVDFIKRQNVAEVYAFDTLAARVNHWLTQELGELALEIYATKDQPMFQAINGQRIVDVILVCSDKTRSIIGVKLLFEEDYILVTAIADGSTVETVQFSLVRDNIRQFDIFSPLTYVSLKALR